MDGPLLVTCLTDNVTYVFFCYIIEMADVLDNFQLDKKGAKKEISKLISCAAPFSKSSIVFSENHQKLAFLAKICMLCTTISYRCNKISKT